MFEWLFILLAPVLPDATPQKDYIGVVAAEAAYASLVPEEKVVKPKVPTKDCKNCKGLGKVPTGDGLGWTKCPECDPNLAADIKQEPSITLEVPTEKASIDDK
jgi:hypothetical protein